MLTGLTDVAALVDLCRSLGQERCWDLDAQFNPSDRLDRVYVKLRYQLSKDVDAEVLGLGPFAFLPATRCAPICALEVRTKEERAKERGPFTKKKSHLADMTWPESRQKYFDQFWQASHKARLEILGGDDSSARARVTFAIPKMNWDGKQ